MSKRFLPVIILVSVLFSACANMRELTKDESEKVFIHDVTLSKPELKTKLLSMISEKFNSGKAVIQVNEDGLISGNGKGFLSSDALGIVKTYIEYTFMIKYQDNQYKTKFIVKNLFNEDTKSTYDVHPGTWGRYTEEIKAFMNDFDRMTISYISAKTDF